MFLLQFPIFHVVSVGGLERPTLCLKGRCSTPELHARDGLDGPVLFANYRKKRRSSSRSLGLFSRFCCPRLLTLLSVQDPKWDKYAIPEHQQHRGYNEREKPIPGFLSEGKVPCGDANQCTAQNLIVPLREREGMNCGLSLLRLLFPSHGTPCCRNKKPSVGETPGPTL